MKKIKKIYICGALTHTGEKQKIVYEKIAEECKKYCQQVYVPHLGGTDPVKNPDVTAFQVWETDHREVASSDLIIAYIGEPSLGVGAELEIARVTASDIVLWSYEGQKVSRMALGNPAVVGRIEAVDDTDLFNKITIQLKKYDY